MRGPLRGSGHPTTVASIVCGLGLGLRSDGVRGRGRSVRGRDQEAVLLAFFPPAVVYMADVVGTQTRPPSFAGWRWCSARRPCARAADGAFVIGVLLGSAFFAFSFAVWDEADVAATAAISLAISCSIATTPMALPQTGPGGSAATPRSAQARWPPSSRTCSRSSRTSRLRHCWSPEGYVSVNVEARAPIEEGAAARAPMRSISRAASHPAEMSDDRARGADREQRRESQHDGDGEAHVVGQRGEVKEERHESGRGRSRARWPSRAVPPRDQWRGRPRRRMNGERGNCSPPWRSRRRRGSRIGG